MSHSIRPQREKLRNHPLHRSTTMAALMLLLRCEFGKGSIVAAGRKQGVVSESMRATLSDTYRSITAPFGKHRTQVVHIAQHTSKGRRRLFEAQRSQGLYEKLSVVGIGGLRAGIPRRVHAGSPLQGIDLQPGVISQAGQTRGSVKGPGLEVGVLFEG